MLYVYETVPVRVLDPRFQIRREIGDLFITNIYIPCDEVSVIEELPNIGFIQR